MRPFGISLFSMMALVACQYGGQLSLTPTATSGYTTITIDRPSALARSPECSNETGKISVLGYDDFRQRTSEALDSLPDQYRELVHCWLKSVLERNVDGHSGQNGTFVGAGMFYAGNTAVQYGSNREFAIKWYAAALAHEAVHIREYENGRPYYGRDGELTSLTIQLEVLKALDAPQSMIQETETIINNIDDPAYQYWNTPAPRTPPAQ
jgi:hypothetical protein